MTTRTTIIASCVQCALLTACQVADSGDVGAPASTNSVEQASTSCDAVIPPRTTFIPGQTQIALATPVDTTGYYVVQDFVKGGFIAALVDVSTGKITIAYAVSNANFPLFMYYSAYKGRIIVPNTPPPPDPGGDKGLARMIVALAYGTTDASPMASAEASACGKI